MNFTLNGCSYQAAKYAVIHWHYSHAMPAGKLITYGVWEGESFKGVVIFSRGANNRLGSPFGLDVTGVCELTRVALDVHTTPVTKIIKVALTTLKRTNPGLRLVVSYADCDQNHHGGIYAGGNWIYLGLVEQNGGTPKYRIYGRVMHGRTVGQRGWKQNLNWLRENIDPKAETVSTLGKHKYIYPLDDEMRGKFKHLHKPYPKRAGSIDADAPDNQSGEGGSNPTPALQNL